MRHARGIFVTALALALAAFGTMVADPCALAQEQKERPRSRPPRVETPAEEAPAETPAAVNAVDNQAPAKPAPDPDFIGPLPPDREEPGPASNVADADNKEIQGPALPQPGSSPTGTNVPPTRGTPTAPVPGGAGGPAPQTTGPAVGPAAPPSSSPMPGVPPSDQTFPKFAEQQPGFIPDASAPGDLFSPAPLPDLGFTTQLGPTKLPQLDAEGLIANQAGSPSMDLPENFARVVVPTGTIEGSTETKQFHIEGGLIIYYSDVTITGDTADIDEKSEIAVIKGHVNIVDPKYSLATDELRIQFEEKRFEANGFVQFKKSADPSKRTPDMTRPKKDRVRDYFAGQQFELYCDQLFYNWDTKEMMALSGVRLVHPSFNGTMERLDYNDKTKQYDMSGKMELEVTDYDWMFSTKMVEPQDEKKMQALTDGSTKVVCERLKYSEETGVAEFYAKPGEKVKFEQPKRSVVASYIEVNDKTKDFYAEGSESDPAVYTQTDGEWLYQAEIIKREDAPEDVQNVLKSTLTAKSGSLTYNYDRKRIEMRGQVAIEGSGTTVTAGELVQDETAKFFLLRDNVLIQPNADSEVRAAQVYVDTANDVITFVGLVQGKAISDEVPSTMPADSGGEPGAPGQAPGVAEGVFGRGGLPGQIPGRGTSSTNVAEKR